jgi:RNA polymerase sigma factor (sigma-70 family)
MPTHDDDPDLTHDPVAPPSPRRGAADVDDVRAASAGDPAAFARLYDRWFDRVVDLAFRIVRDQSLAADVAQDTFVRAYRNLERLDDPFAFGGWLLRIARNRAYDVGAAHARAQAVDDQQLAIIERRGSGAVSAPSGFAVEDRLARAESPAEAAEDRELVALVWEAAEALGERDREVLDLQLRHGLEPAEIAEVIGVNRNAANQAVHRVKQRLATAIAARILWRSGSPACVDLRAVLAESDHRIFDGDTVRLVDRHAASCEACQDRRRTRLDPAVMFSVAPMLALPALKAKVAAALAAEGVPVDPVARSSANADSSHGSDGTSVSDAAGVVDQAGGSGGSDGSTPTEGSDGSVPTDLPSVRARRAMAVGAAAALVAVLLAIGWTILPRDGGSDIETVPAPTGAPSAPTAAIGTTSSTRALATATTVDARGATTTTGAVVVAPTSPATSASTSPPTSPPTTAPATTTTTAPVPSGSLTISKSTVAFPSYSMTADPPTITWSTTNVASVTVSGPNVSASALDGSRAVCPGVEGGGTCTLTPSIGTVTYRLRGYSAGGVLVVDRSVTLTVTPP